MTIATCRIVCPRTGETRRFNTARLAEAYARKRVARTRQEFQIEGCADGINGMLIAYVRLDAYDRVWTDVAQVGGSLL